ncbi:hypothetical protein AAC387_Pa06g2348 [Persea americana]
MASRLLHLSQFSVLLLISSMMFDMGSIQESSSLTPKDWFASAQNHVSSSLSLSLSLAAALVRKTLSLKDVIGEGYKMQMYMGIWLQSTVTWPICNHEGQAKFLNYDYCTLILYATFGPLQTKSRAHLTNGHHDTNLMAKA